MIPTRPQGHHHHNYWPSLSTRSLKTLSTSSITITTTAAMTTTITKALSLLSGLRKWFEGNVFGSKQLGSWTQVQQNIFKTVSVFSDKIHENSGVWLWRVGWKVSATHLMLSSKSTMEMIIVRTIFVMRRIYPYNNHDITSITARVTKPLDSKYEPPQNITF